MSLSEEPTYGAASIPAQQSTEENAATKENQTQRLYRNSLPSSSDSPSSQLPLKGQPHLPRTESNLPVAAESETGARKQKDQDSSSDESNDTSSSNSSANGKDDDDMLSVRDLSSSSTSSLAMPTGDVPALPAKSSLRASRLLASIPQKRAPNDDQPMLPHAAPHQVYLSSEEDASSSADDFSDFDDEMESDGEGGSQKPSTRNMAREDTARVVAVVFHGKPSIVTLSPRRSISPSSSEVGQPGTGLLRTATEPSLQHQRPRSVSSATSVMKFNHPPRSSSMTTGFEKKRPHFLHIDPYAKVRDEAAEHLRGPMTPTSMFRRTLSLVKKRSKPNLHQSESQLTPMEKVGEVEEEEDPRESLCLEPNSVGPVSNQRHGSVSSPRSEASSPISPKSRFRTGLSLGRQRSVKA
ncbi:uncharacterized protein G6M90_00g004400 [Metarhizium brunneum]|uniref:Uncharacterized protein n=1 Tax=Metarhizium brunneum TaxID=500148 RepID=A0A7D5USM1_9HYPO